MFVVTILVLLIINYLVLFKQTLQSQHANAVKILGKPIKVNKNGYINETHCWRYYVFNNKNKEAVLALCSVKRNMLPQTIMLRIVAAIIHEDYP